MPKVFVVKESYFISMPAANVSKKFIESNLYSTNNTYVIQRVDNGFIIKPNIWELSLWRKGVFPVILVELFSQDFGTRVEVTLKLRASGKILILAMILLTIMMLAETHSASLSSVSLGRFLFSFLPVIIILLLTLLSFRKALSDFRWNLKDLFSENFTN